MQNVKANVFRAQSVKANLVRTMRATASAFQMRTVRAFPFWTQNVKVNLGKKFETSPITIIAPVAPVRAQLYFASVRIWIKIITFI